MASARVTSGPCLMDSRARDLSVPSLAGISSANGPCFCVFRQFTPSRYRIAPISRHADYKLSSYAQLNIGLFLTTHGRDGKADQDEFWVLM